MVRSVIKKSFNFSVVDVRKRIDRFLTCCVLGLTIGLCVISPEQ